jgi:hypothetical protein
LSPGGKFVAVAGTEGVIWFRAEGGQAAGTLPWPPTPATPPGRLNGVKYPPHRPEGLAVTSDGRRLTATLRSHEEVILFTWDLESGAPARPRPTRVGRNGPAQYTQYLAWGDLPLAWLGPRLVLLDGCVVYDPESDRVVWEYSAPEPMRAAATSPDGRLWFVPKPGASLSAVRLPHAPAAERADLAASPTLFPPGSAVRVEATGGPNGVRRQLAEAVAHRLAAAGVRVAPDAKAVVRVAITGPFETTSKSQVGMPRDGRIEFRVMPALGMTATVTAIGSDGEPLGAPDTKTAVAIDAARPAAEKAPEELLVWANTLEFRGRMPADIATKLNERQVSDYP